MRLSDRTILTDLNRGGFPDGQFDVVAALGVLEFVHDAAAVLTTARDRAGLMIATYCAKNTDNLDTRLERGYVNDFTRDEFVRACQKSGWQIVYAERLIVGPGFDQWLFALRGCSEEG